MWTRQRIATELRRVALDVGWPTAPLLRRLHGPALLDAIEHEFGTIEVARFEARLGRQEPRYVDAEAVVEGLRELDERGVRINPRGLTEAGETRLVSAIYRYFSNFVAAREAAGLAPPDPKPRPVACSVDDAVRQLRSRRRDLGRTPRLSELSGPAGRRLVRHFGRYAAALEALGLESPLRSNQKWTRATIVRELRELHRAGHRITSAALEEAGRNDILLAIYRHFESFPEARRAARISRLNRRSERPPERFLSDANVRKLRERYATGTVTQRQLAHERGITIDRVADLLLGRSRASAGGPIHAPSNGRVLTRKQAKAIIRRAAQGATRSALARVFGVSRSTITRIVRGELYADVHDAPQRSPRRR